MKQQQPPQVNLRIDPRTLPDGVCDACGHEFFEIVFKFKRVSPIISGKAKEEWAPIDMFACKKCGHVNDALDPLKQVQPATEMPPVDGQTPMEPGKIIV